MTAPGLLRGDDRLTTPSGNAAWGLKSFVDSLIVELDRAQDALGVKGLTRPVTYSVRDVELDLRCFPQYDGRAVRFVTAQPGQEGSSGLRFSLGSISAGTIRDSAPPPPQTGDVSFESLDELEPEAREALENVGIRSVRDLERVAARGVDLRSATSRKAPGYGDLAAMITRAGRRRDSPAVRSASLSAEDGRLVLYVDGEHLQAGDVDHPVALLDGRRVPVRSADARRLVLDASGYRPRAAGSRLTVALDPSTILTAELTL